MYCCVIKCWIPFYSRVHRQITSFSFSRCCNFLKAPRCSLSREGPRGLFSNVTHSLRNLAVINDHRAAHSFKQQTFPREKILYIRNDRSKRVFLYLPFKITFCPRAFTAKIARSLRIGLVWGLTLSRCVIFLG